MPSPKPTGSITEENGKFRVRVRREGRRITLGTFDTIEEARQELHEDNEEQKPQPGGLTLRTWGETWLRRRKRDGLHRAHKKDADRWSVHIAGSTLADRPVRRITRQDVVRWVRGMMRKETHGGGRTLARQTVANALNLLRRALQDAADEGHATSNVAKDVEVPKKPRADDGWTWLRTEEIDAVLRARPRASTPAQRDAITLAIYTGLRAGELWGLRWCDVTLDGPRPELHVRRNRSGPTKSGQDRHVPLLPMAVEALRSRRAASPGVGAALVFPGKKGKPHGEGYDAGWPSWMRAAGIARRVRFHDLRHTCASHLVQGTWTTRPLRLEDVRQWGGWSTIKMCERYAHLAPEALHSYLDGVVRPVTPAKELGP